MSADTLIVFLGTNQRSQIPLTPPTGLTGPTSPISQATAACFRQQKKSPSFDDDFLFSSVGVTGFEPATTRPPDAYSNRAELHPVAKE